MNKAVLILNTKKNKIFNFLISKISRNYELKTFYLDGMENITKNKIINEINNYILSNEVQYSFFQGCYISLIDYQFIKKIKTKKKILYVSDDFDVHEVNAITSQACDLVLTGCPVSVLKYEEKKINCFYLPLEGDNKILKNYNLKKDIDLLFFGAIKADRKIYLEKLQRENYNLKVIGTDHKNKISDEELAKYISRSKIVLNFSQTGNKNKFYSHKTIPFNYYQFKGRVLMAGLCETLCISEISPGGNIILNDEFPTFSNYKEMLENINYFLKNPELLKTKTKEFYKKCMYYSDDNYMPYVSKKIDTSENKNEINFNIPFWYSYIFLKKSIQLYFRMIRGKIFK